MDSGFHIISVEVGEIIHSLGNGLVSGDVSIGSLTVEDGRILQELGHALRVDFPRPVDNSQEFPVLSSHNFNPGTHEKLMLVSIASRMIGNAGVVSFRDCCEKESKEFRFGASHIKPVTKSLRLKKQAYKLVAMALGIFFLFLWFFLLYFFFILSGIAAEPINLADRNYIHGIYFIFFSGISAVILRYVQRCCFNLFLKRITV